EVAGHEVDVVGQVFPDAGHAFDFGLPAQLTLGADLARDARDFRGERAELVDHGDDESLQLEDVALHVDGDLLRLDAVRYCRRHVGNVSDLSRQVAGHRVDVIRQIFPGSRHAFNFGLPAELTLGADLAGDTSDFRGE